MTKVKDNKIFGLFYDNFRLPGYPILSALSMKVLKIDSALAIIIVQKLVLFLFIFWVFKKLNKLKVNNLGFAIVSFFILFPFSVIINFAESDLTEFFLFILFSILTYNTIFERNSIKTLCLLINYYNWIVNKIYFYTDCNFLVFIFFNI